MRYPALTIEWRGTRGGRRKATFDGAGRARLAARQEAATAPDAQHDRVVGTLVEADFERHTARVATSEGRPVTVTFAEDLADDIQRWLRRPGELEGRVEYDTRSGAASRVELHRIVRPVQLRVVPGDREFHRVHRVHDLAAEQGVVVVADLDALVDASATEAELKAFLDALGS